MRDLFFKHDLTIATDIGAAIEMRAGEILTGVPLDLAGRLLRRSDVTVADPKSDARRIEFAKPRGVPAAIASIVSPPLDEQRLAEDEERAQKLADAKRAREKRLREEAEASRRKPAA